jgi:acetate kinase
LRRPRSRSRALSLEREEKDANAVSNLLYNESGLLGVSGVSDDMQTLLAARDPHAKEAIALFIYRIGRELGSLSAALGGLDALVFTAGVGEHAAEVRRKVLEDAAWLGVELDSPANASGGPRLTHPTSRVAAFVIPTNEDLMIARHSWDCLKRNSGFLDNAAIAET